MVRVGTRSALFVAFLALAGCGVPDVIPDPVTDDGDRLHGLWWFSNWAGLAVALLVWALIAFVVIRYRRRSEALPSQRAENIPVEVLYTLGPLALVAVFFGLSVAVESDVNRVRDDPDVVVEAVAFQWQWEFRYPEEGIAVTGTDDEVPVMVLPVGRTVRFRLETLDVIHSFWVPRFLEKRDMIPGVDNEIDVEVTEAGEWSGVCAEFCGLDHYKMRFGVRAVPPDEYAAWVRDQRRGRQR